MQRSMFLRRPRAGTQWSPMDRRAGAIAVLTAVMLVMLLGFTAFSVDLGYIALNRNQMQNAADSAALAASIELARGWGVGAAQSEAETIDAARAIATQIGSLNQMAGQTGVFIDPTRDVRFGNRQWDPSAGKYVETWGVGPYNLVEVTVRRTGASANPDGAIDLFFAPALGQDTAEVLVSSTVALSPGVGFRVEGSILQWANILPMAYDEQSWNELLDGHGADDFAYDEQTGSIRSGRDNVLEFNLYPNGNVKLPPGNRGTVDFGHQGNSTADLKRQILYGLNEDDLSYFGGEFRLDDLPMELNGDTGISAGIESELKRIIGMPRVIPIFSDVSGPGNNAQYTIVKFVGIRLLSVKLRGGNKYVIAQPASFTDGTIIRGEDRVITEDSILAPGVLVR